MSHNYIYKYNIFINQILISFFVYFFRVLKPPGGGSSDIFGASNGSAASTPRSVSKNHMVSNIFGAPQNRNGKPIRENFGDLYSCAYNSCYQSALSPSPFNARKLHQTADKEHIDSFSSVFIKKNIVVYINVYVC